MRVLVSFPISGDMAIDEGWPVTLRDRSLFIRRENGLAREVTVTFAGVNVDLAPTFGQETSEEPPTLRIHDDFRLRAERDLRAWQSLLAPYVPLSIDYSAASLEYVAERVEEQEKIKIHSFSSKGRELVRRGFQDYSIFGRAFLALENGYEEIDRMVFFLEARRLLDRENYIDAYNNFYLYFESNYHLPTKTAGAVNKLLGTPDFIQALRKFISEKFWINNLSGMMFRSAKSVEIDERRLTLDIVGLRGFLRHHTLSNPARWDPTKQGKYQSEARFLGAIALTIASPRVFMPTFDAAYADEFLRQAKEMNMMTSVRVVMTFRDDEVTREVAVDMNFPTTSVSSSLAKAVLTKALGIFEEKSPGGELYAMRARVLPNGPELFRYDLGPSISR